MKKLILIILIIPSALFAQVNSGLTNWLPFNGDANDSIGSLQPTIYGAILDTGRGGITNGSYFFDGINDYIHFGTVDPIGDSSDGTVCIWFNPFTTVVPNDTNSNNRINDNEYLFSTGGETSSIGYAMIWSKGRLESSRKTNSQGAASGQTGYADNNWHHVCFTYRDSLNQIKMYLDGSVIADSKGSTASYTNSYKDVNVGRGSKYLGRNDFYGLIDDIRIYNRVLSQKEVDTLYDENIVVAGIKKLNQVPSTIFEVYPNPTTGLTNLEGKFEDYTEFRLFNSIGQEVLSQKIIHPSLISFDISKYPAGIYFLDVIGLEGKTTIKLMKE